MLTRVLVVDDDEEMTDLLKIVLAPDQFEVFAANSGQEALDMTQQLLLDVVILDLLMPDMDGLEVIKEIRKYSDIPVLVLSAISSPGMTARALDQGADDYLTKPMTSGVLVAHVKKLARRARAEQAVSVAKVGMRL